jgi:hypothetical protein
MDVEVRTGEVSATEQQPAASPDTDELDQKLAQHRDDVSNSRVHRRARR